MVLGKIRGHFFDKPFSYSLCKISFTKKLGDGLFSLLDALAVGRLQKQLSCL